MSSSVEDGNIGSGSEVCDLRSEDSGGDGELNDKITFNFNFYLGVIRCRNLSAPSSTKEAPPE